MWPTSIHAASAVGTVGHFVLTQLRLGPLEAQSTTWKISGLGHHDPVRPALMWKWGAVNVT